MTKIEFKQKMTDIKQKMEKILSELEDCDAYIFNQYEFRHFHSQIKEHLDRIIYILDNFESRNTSDKWHDNSFNEFNNLLTFFTNKWERLKKIKFIPPRSFNL